MTVSDSLDGQLARYLKQVTFLGKLLDPIADYVLTTVAIILLCVIGVPDLSDPTGERILLLPMWVAVATVGKDVLTIIGFGLAYAVTGNVFLQPRFLGKACTDVQLALILNMLLWPDLPLWLSGLPKILWYTASVLAVATVFDYLRLASAHVVAVAAENRQRQLTEGDKIDADGQR